MTDAEIRAIIDAFLNTVGTTQYIGARYVPTFGRLGEDTWQWDGGAAAYEPLVIVQWQGDSYTSRKAVPAGIDISDAEYWANTGNFNGQLAQIRELVRTLNVNVQHFSEQVGEVQDALAAEAGTRAEADANLQSNIDSERDVREQADETLEQADAALQDAIDSEAEARAAADATLQGNIDAEAEARTAADSTLQDNIDAEADMRVASDASLGERITSMEEHNRLYLMGGYVAPIYAGDFMDNMQFGCCCRKDDNMYTFSPTNFDNLGVVRIFDMENNILLRTINDVVMGHGNSCCWDSVRNRFWIAPINTYNQGVSTATNELYYTNETISVFGTHELPVDDFAHGVSFDATTETLYVIFAHNDELMQPDTINVWAMGPEDSEFTLYKTIQDPELVSNTGSSIWQDFAVYDNVLIAARVDGTSYVIPMYVESPKVKQTFRIGEIDAGGIWSYGEVEGLEFDAKGRLYNARNGNVNAFNVGEQYQINCCFVTELNTAHRITPTDTYRLNQYYTLTVDTSNTFRLGRWNIRSLNQLVWRMDRFGRVNIPENVTYTDGLIRMCDRHIKIDVAGTMSIARIVLDSGTLFLFVQGGNLTFSNGSDAAIDANSDAAQIYFRCLGGTMTYNTAGEFVNFGYAPAIFCTNGLDNIDSIVVEGVTVTGPTMLMGNRRVYAP